MLLENHSVGATRKSIWVVDSITRSRPKNHEP